LAGIGARYIVVDSSQAGFLQQVSIGGSSVVPVWSDGFNWWSDDRPISMDFVAQLEGILRLTHANCS
jgi:hypothetical protein